jgi:hypothetical protein
MSIRIGNYEFDGPAVTPGVFHNQSGVYQPVAEMPDSRKMGTDSFSRHGQLLYYQHLTRREKAVCPHFPQPRDFHHGLLCGPAARCRNSDALRAGHRRVGRYP